jgi:hypothetical protein
VDMEEECKTDFSLQGDKFDCGASAPLSTTSLSDAPPLRLILLLHHHLNPSLSTTSLLISLTSVSYSQDSRSFARGRCISLVGSAGFSRISHAVVQVSRHGLKEARAI